MASDERVSAPAGAGAAHLHASAAAPDPEPERQPLRGVGALVARVKVLIAWWNRTRAARANARFGAAGGGVLTGGIAYAALFSVFAGLTLGFTVFMAVLGNNVALRDRVVHQVAESLPGLIDTGDGQGLIDPTSLRLSGGATLAGAIALVTLLGSATSAMGALQTGVRAMFGIRSSENAVAGKLRQLGGFVAMGLAVLLGALLGLGVTASAGWVGRVVHWGGVAVLAQVAGIVVGVLVDAATFALVVVGLAGARPARRDLVRGALIAGVGLGVVRFVGASAVAGSVTTNPLFASFAVIVVLLVWINLIARIVLLAAAWTADPPAATP